MGSAEDMLISSSSDRMVINTSSSEDVEMASAGSDTDNKDLAPMGIDNDTFVGEVLSSEVDNKEGCLTTHEADDENAEP